MSKELNTTLLVLKDPPNWTWFFNCFFRKSCLCRLCEVRDKLL